MTRGAGRTGRSFSSSSRSDASHASSKARPWGAVLVREREKRGRKRWVRPLVWHVYPETVFGTLIIPILSAIYSAETWPEAERRVATSARLPGAAPRDAQHAPAAQQRVGADAARRAHHPRERPDAVAARDGACAGEGHPRRPRAAQA